MDSVRGFEVGLYAGKKAWEIRIIRKWQSGLSEVFAVRLVVVRQQPRRLWPVLEPGPVLARYIGNLGRVEADSRGRRADRG